MDQQDLFRELQGLRRSLAKLLPELPPHAEDWRPDDRMRTAWELANHLVQIPAVDTAIAQEKVQAEIQQLERELTTNTVEGLLAVWDRGIAAAETHFNALSPDQFETVETTAFYGHGMKAKEWLLEIVTHTYHHRAQLFTYLKLKGRPVDMSYLYA